jgi:hypothetical protein
MTDAARLIGGWRLRSWVSIADDGAEARPLGEAPDGLLAYTADSTMVGIMSPGDRPRFATDDVTGGTAEDQAAAFARRASSRTGTAPSNDAGSRSATTAGP